MRGLKFRNKLGAAFGSYGWSGESVKEIEEHFRKCSIPVACEGIRVKWQPREEDLAACREFGRRLADSLKPA
jgi:flavorubredoxin